MSRVHIKAGITACGGDLAQNAMQALQCNSDIDFTIHGFDTDANVGSRCVADYFHAVPNGADHGYVSQIREIIKKEGLDVLLPWSDEEAVALAPFRDEFLDYGCKVIVSPQSVIEVVCDKALTYDKLSHAGIRTPEYVVATTPNDIWVAAQNFGFPAVSVVVKPSGGRGGRDVHVLLGNDHQPEWLGAGRREQRVDTKNLERVLGSFVEGERWLVMPCLSSPVYDVDVFCKSGETLGCYVRERINPAGIPFAGNILRADSSITEYVTGIANVLELDSLHDIDLMTRPGEGPVLLEVNPRPSGSLAALPALGIPLLEAVLATNKGVHIDLPIPLSDTVIEIPERRVV